jgi:hypothetical protein
LKSGAGGARAKDFRRHNICRVKRFRHLLVFAPEIVLLASECSPLGLRPA